MYKLGTSFPAYPITLCTRAMLTEETRSFSDDAAGDGSKETGSVRLNQHKNNTLAISVVTNVVLLFVCIALGIIVMFRSGPDRSRPAKETAGHSLVSTPYCKVVLCSCADERADFFPSTR